MRVRFSSVSSVVYRRSLLGPNEARTPSWRHAEGSPGTPVYKTAPGAPPASPHDGFPARTVFDVYAVWHHMRASATVNPHGMPI